VAFLVPVVAAALTVVFTLTAAGAVAAPPILNMLLIPRMVIVDRNLLNSPPVPGIGSNHAETVCRGAERHSDRPATGSVGNGPVCDLAEADGRVGADHLQSPAGDASLYGFRRPLLILYTNDIVRFEAKAEG
jgi:hypothetical protein